MRFLLIAIATLSLHACVTPTKTIKPLNEKESGVRNIQKVYVSYSDLSKTSLVQADQNLKEKGAKDGEGNAIKYQPLKSTLQNIVKDRLEQRDGDQNKYADVFIEVDNLKLADPVAALLIGDSDQLAGTVRVTDPKTKEVLTEFYVDVLKGTGGLIGLAVRGSGVREKLSAQFADFIGDHLGYQKIESVNTYKGNKAE